MAENNVKYDAFISYRHSELDKFVATTLHKKLDAFKLPKGVKSPTGKTKIERVFRDQDELPLSSNLSDPINIALENSDYLLVICTPRLPQSEWCKKEIETFKKLHGKENVLAVLAEGEPDESFPEALIKEEYEEINPDGTKEIKVRINEPLAADVRGKSKRAMKKAMNDAVLRICAAIFGLNYDALKQRHKERAMRRTIAIISGVAAGFMLFTAVCIGFMFKIINQSEMILDQNAEIMSQNAEIKTQSDQIMQQKEQIEAQYTESQINLAQATTVSAETLINDGRKLDAVYALRKVMPTSSNDKSYPYTAETEYALSKALDVYANPGHLVGGRTFESESIIKSVKSSPNGTRVASVDACGNLHVWNLETGEELYANTLSIPIGHDDNAFFLPDEDSIVFRNDKEIKRVNYSDNSEKTITNPDMSEGYVGDIYYFKNKANYMIFSADGFTMFDTKTDAITESRFYEELYDDAYIFSYNNVAVSADEKYVALTFSPAASGVYDLIIFDTETDEMKKYELPIDIASSLIFSDHKIYISAAKYIGNSLSDSEDHLICMDAETGKVIWNVVAPAYLNEIKQNPASNKLFGYGYSTLYVFDTENGKCLDSYNAQAQISGLSAYDDGRAAVFTANGIMYSYTEGTMGLYTYQYFNNTPTIRIEKYYGATDGVFLQFAGETYFTHYKNKPDKGVELIKAYSSAIMTVNEAEGFLRLNNDAKLIEYFTLKSGEPSMSTEKKNSNYTFVGDGSEYFASFGSGLCIQKISDGSIVKELGMMDTPSFGNGAVTNDRNYIISDMSFQGDIFLYSLSTGEVEEVLRPDIPEGENVTVYGLSRDYYAVKRESGVLEIYKIGEKEPVFTTKRVLSSQDDVRVCYKADCFTVTYFDSTIEIYSFGNECKLLKTTKHSELTSAGIEEFNYYAGQGMYVLAVNNRTILFNEDFEMLAFIPYRASYIPSKDYFAFYSASALRSVKHYHYDDLIKESNVFLGDYYPSEFARDTYNLAK